MNQASPHPHTRVFFVPGMFGFAKLAGYDYFTHVKERLQVHFDRKGVQVSFYDVPTPPTSSLRHRAKILSATMSKILALEIPFTSWATPQAVSMLASR